MSSSADKVSNYPKLFISRNLCFNRNFQNYQVLPALSVSGEQSTSPVLNFLLFYAFVSRSVVNPSMLLSFTSLSKGVNACHCSYNCWILKGTLCSLNVASACFKCFWTIIGKDQVRHLLCMTHNGTDNSTRMLFIWKSTT